MKKSSDYRAHAEECRALARNLQGEQRDQLLAMAATWDSLATDRSELIRRHPDPATEGECSEESNNGQAR